MGVARVDETRKGPILSANPSRLVGLYDVCGQRIDR
jgi:hypothetical protein